MVLPEICAAFESRTLHGHAYLVKGRVLVAPPPRGEPWFFPFGVPASLPSPARFPNRATRALFNARVKFTIWRSAECSRTSPGRPSRAANASAPRRHSRVWSFFERRARLVTIAREDPTRGRPPLTSTRPFTQFSFSKDAQRKSALRRVAAISGAPSLDRLSPSSSRAAKRLTVDSPWLLRPHA